MSPVINSFVCDRDQLSQGLIPLRQGGSVQGGRIPPDCGAVWAGHHVATGSDELMMRLPCTAELSSWARRRCGDAEGGAVWEWRHGDAFSAHAERRGLCMNRYLRERRQRRDHGRRHGLAGYIVRALAVSILRGGLVATARRPILGFRCGRRRTKPGVNRSRGRLAPGRGKKDKVGTGMWVPRRGPGAPAQKRQHQRPIQRQTCDRPSLKRAGEKSVISL